MIMLMANIKLRQENNVYQFFDCDSVRFLNCQISKAEKRDLGGYRPDHDDTKT